MNKTLLDKRKELLLRKEAICQRRAGGSATDLAGALEEVVRQLHALAVEADATGGDPFELARNWRHLADSHVDMPGGQAPEKLAKAVSYYKRAEVLMKGIESSNERMLLEYGYGRALFGMVRCGDMSVVDEAKSRFSRAQAIAHLQEPQLGEMISRTLMHLQLIANLIEERKTLWRDIDRREKSRRDSGTTEFDQNPMPPEDARLFERLLELCQRIDQVRAGEMASL